MAGKRKSFKANAALQVTTKLPSDGARDSWIISFPPNATTLRAFDFGPWIAKGLDEVAGAAISAINALQQAGHPRTATLVGYCNRGMNLFLDFLIERTHPTSVEGIDRRCIDDFIEWLRAKPQLAYGSQKKIYFNVKGVLAFLRDRGLDIGADPFPKNPYPRSNDHVESPTALTPKEQAELARAVKADLIAIHRGTFTGEDSDVVAVFIVIIAMRTGLNAEPLISLTRDCLRPHPFRPNLRVLRAFKWRGRATQVKVLRQSFDEATHKALQAGGAVVVEMALRHTAPLVDEASVAQRSQLWLFRSAAARNPGQVTHMTASNFATRLWRLVERHSLRAEASDKPLVLNVSRIRKTVEGSFWRLSGGSLFQVAHIMQQTPGVADQSYLHATEQMERNHAFLGEALVNRWRGAGEAGQKVVPLFPYSDPKNMTPVSRCKDPINGEMAPKDGSDCMDFLSCFSCRSFVVVEDEQDLHRLFSFYWFLGDVIKSFPETALAISYRDIMSLIDSVTSKEFDAGVVTTARIAAKNDRHPFWRNPILGEMLNAS